MLHIYVCLHTGNIIYIMSHDFCFCIIFSYIGGVCEFLKMLSNILVVMLKWLASSLAVQGWFATILSCSQWILFSQANNAGKRLLRVGFQSGHLPQVVASPPLLGSDLDKRSDIGPETNYQDSKDYGVCPKYVE